MGTSDSDDDVAKLLFGVLGLLVSVLLRGYVLSQLWSWFVVPLGVVAVSIPHAIGISCIAAMLSGSSGGGKESEGVAVVIIGGVVGVLFVWGFGAIVHAWM